MNIKAKTNELKSDSKFGMLMAKPEMTVLMALIVLCVLMAIARPETFPTVQNVFNILRQFSLIAILAVGMGMIIITTGIDLSVGSVIALSATFGAYVYKMTDAPPIVVLLLILGMGTLCGLGKRLICRKGRYPGIHCNLGYAEYCKRRRAADYQRISDQLSGNLDIRFWRRVYRCCSRNRAGYGSGCSHRIYICKQYPDGQKHICGRQQPQSGKTVRYSGGQNNYFGIYDHRILLRHMRTHINWTDEQRRSFIRQRL